MLVCEYCLQEIESHDGRQKQRRLDDTDPRINENNECVCEWCGESVDAYEIKEI